MKEIFTKCFNPPKLAWVRSQFSKINMACAILLLGGAQVSFGQGHKAFRHLGPDQEYVSTVEIDEHNRDSYIGGYTNVTSTVAGNVHDGHLWKTNEFGSEIWNYLYNVSHHNYTYSAVRINDVVQKDNSLYVVGDYFGYHNVGAEWTYDNYGLILEIQSSTGNVMNHSLYQDMNFATVDIFDNTIAVGGTYIPATGVEGYVVTMNQGFSPISQRRFPGIGSDYTWIKDIRIIGDDVYVTGFMNGDVCGNGIDNKQLFARLDKNDLSQGFAQLYRADIYHCWGSGAVASSQLYGHEFVVTDNYTYLVGIRRSTDLIGMHDYENDIYVLKVENGNGGLLWSNTYKAPELIDWHNRVTIDELSNNHLIVSNGVTPHYSEVSYLVLDKASGGIVNQVNWTYPNFELTTTDIDVDKRVIVSVGEVFENVAPSYGEVVQYTSLTQIENPNTTYACFGKLNYTMHNLPVTQLSAPHMSKQTEVSQAEINRSTLKYNTNLVCMSGTLKKGFTTSIETEEMEASALVRVEWYNLLGQLVFTGNEIAVPQELKTKYLNQVMIRKAIYENGKTEVVKNVVMQ